MADGTKYLLYRKYSGADRYDPREQLVFYGWSNSKAVVTAFLAQRSPKKYKVRKFCSDTMDIEDYVGDDTFIDWMPLKSARTREDVKLFITKREKEEAEKNIQAMFRDLSSLGYGERIVEVLTLFVNLDDYYFSALDFLGFRPPELEAMFPTSTSDTEEFISDDMTNKIIYSLESFVRVLRDDM